ncbi:MAG: hypothetical protein RL077_3622 [Verrucomicrobiota bacterium]
MTVPLATVSPHVVGQRCMSEREPELGLGLVARIDAVARRIGVDFPATGEKRLYALGTPVLKRVGFRVGEVVKPRTGPALTIEVAEEVGGLWLYSGQGRRLPESEVSDVTSVSLPHERLMAGQVDPGEVFELRYRALEKQASFRSSPLRGFLGGRLELIPHQFYILQEVAARRIPRVLLADEVGLGKTIEACLILQRLLAVGQARRVLIVVPEPLTHQWFVELLRRFNLWFSIYDEARCVACEQSDAGQNPFQAAQLVLSSVSFLADNEARRDQVVGAGWDMVVVDEAHHLAWSPEQASPAYVLAERLAQVSRGLLLLTATPTQLGLVGHFARLRLLDPQRYTDFAVFRQEAERFESVAGVAEKIIEGKVLKPKDRRTLKTIFNRDPERLAQHLDALERAEVGAREALLRTLLDQHGTGRVVFRNTRAAMSGFPARKFCPVPLSVDNNLTQLARVARELQAEEAGEEGGTRYSYKEDPRIDWLVSFLKKNRAEKVLLICKSQRKVVAIEAALQEKIAVKSGLFHEGLALVQRDRQAAWFAEPEGAQLLICSELGSEGRNFQFAHHLVLFDLPLNPGLIEQRIGRLDRIGQTQTIRLHVPFIAGGAEECIVEWYHRGLDAFETSLQGGNEYAEAFRERLLSLALTYGEGRAQVGRAALDALIAETVVFREALSLKMKKGRDRLLELNSFNATVADRVVAEVMASETDTTLQDFLSELLDHFGVRIKEHEEGDVFLDPSHAYMEGFPSIPAEGMLATFARKRAIVREDIRFITPDHALVQDAIDLLVDSKAGTTAFGFIAADKPNLLLEVVFVLETVADSRWHLDQFLAPVPVRVLVDVRGADLSAGRSAASIAEEFGDAPIQRFLERPSFNLGLLKTLLASATKYGEERAVALRANAQATALAQLSADRQRLVDLNKINDHVRPEEIALAQLQLEQTRAAIEESRLRLDSMRLIIEGVNPNR